MILSFELNWLLYLLILDEFLVIIMGIDSIFDVFV